ncbi:MAG: type 4a pilus biogenesis protein PilO [Myxococcota bacterium]
MAQENVLNQLAKLPPAQKVGLLVGGFLVVGALYYVLFYSSMEDELSNLESSRKSLVDKISNIDKQMAGKKHLAADFGDTQAKLDKCLKSLPTSAQLPSFFEQLQRKAADAGVNIRSWVRSKEVKVDLFIRVPVTVEVSGTFQDIMQYFYLLGPDVPQGGSSQSSVIDRCGDRVVSIENLSLDKPQLSNGQVLLNAKFVASTFRREEDPAERKARNQKKAKKGAAAKVEKAAKDREKKVDQKTGEAEGGNK